MLIDTRGDERMRHLHQECGGAAEEQEALAVYPACDAVGRQDPGVAHKPLVPAVIVSRREVERRRVDAVAHARRAWSIREEMAEVSAAVAAGDLGAHHPERVVFLCRDVALLDDVIEARPARP